MLMTDVVKEKGTESIANDIKAIFKNPEDEILKPLIVNDIFGIFQEG